MGGIFEFQGRGGFLDWNSEGMGGKHSLEFQRHGVVLALDFQMWETARALLEIADLLTFLLRKSSTKLRRPQAG